MIDMTGCDEIIVLLDLSLNIRMSPRLVLGSDGVDIANQREHRLVELIPHVRQELGVHPEDTVLSEELADHAVGE
jgi:hypothetical protein